MAAQLREPTDRGVLAGDDPSLGEALRATIRLGLIERYPDDRVAVAAMLREAFAPQPEHDAAIQQLHNAAATYFERRSQGTAATLADALAAEYHAALAGRTVAVETRLLDGALAAATHLQDSNPREALRILQPLLQRNPRSPVYRLAAVLFAKTGQIDDCLSHAEQFFAAQPHDTYLLSELGKIALSQNQHDSLGRRLLRIGWAANLDPIALFMLDGRFALREGRLRDAEESFVQAKERTTKTAWPFFYLGRIYTDTGRFDKAIDILRAGEDFASRQHRRERRVLIALRAKLALAYYLDGSLDAAEQILQLIQKEDPTNPQAQQVAAAIHVQRNGITDTPTVLSILAPETCKERSDRFQQQLLVGLFHRSMQDFQSAVQAFRAALRDDRSNVLVLTRLSECLIALARGAGYQGGSTEEPLATEAATHLRAVLALDTDNAEAIELLQTLHRDFEIDV